MKNEMGRADLNMNIEVGYNTKEVSLLQTKLENPVWNPPFNNWSVN